IDYHVRAARYWRGRGKHHFGNNESGTLTTEARSSGHQVVVQCFGNGPLGGVVIIFMLFAYDIHQVNLINS
ncbi:TPA: hypothetical protein ACIABV_004787, partial [Escherichia coli]